MRATVLLFVAVLCYVLVVTSCIKSGENNNTNQIQSTISISPTRGPFGTIDTIRGDNFSTTATLNSVKFNGLNATVISASKTQLIVSVPKLAGTGNVSVTVDGRTAIGPVFTYDTTLVVTTIAGSDQGYVDGVGAAAKFNSPAGIAIDAAGNIFVCDKYNHSIRKVTPDGVVTTLAGNGTQGYVDAFGSAARFVHPEDLAIDAIGNLYIAGSSANIRKVTPAGLVTTIAGNGTFGRQDGPANQASFYTPAGIIVDNANNIFISDLHNTLIRKLSPDGIVSTVAGKFGGGFSDGTGNQAAFWAPRRLSVDNKGNIFVSDATRLRKVTYEGVVTTFAGSTTAGSIDSIGTAAKFQGIDDVILMPDGNFLVADANKLRIISTPGAVRTYVRFAENNNDGPVPGAGARGIVSLAIDRLENIYFSDAGNHRIRKLTVQ